MAPTSFEVTQRGAGVNLSVDIAANISDAQGSGIAAVVMGDSVTAQGLYAVPPHSVAINEAVAAAHATLPRVDRVVLEIQDNTHDASGQNRFQVRVISGTATSGATLDNLTGVAAVPSNCLLLADVHVPATDTTIANSQIRDRRKWARGAYMYFEGDNSGDATDTTGNYVVGGGVTAKRLELSGAPLEVRFTGQLANSSAGSSSAATVIYDATNLGETRVTSPAANETDNFCFQDVSTPAAGSHTFAMGFSTVTATTTTATLRNSNGIVPRLIVREIVGQSTANNATTSG